jgi:hypothetical protein
VTAPQRSIEPARDPDAREIADQLARIMASAALRGAPRLSAFLRFVVEMTLAGRGDRIKGYTIAVGALGRAADFDPQCNAIVRVEAGRLRRALARFYAGEGRDEPVLIELPRGGYVPNFRRRGIGVTSAVTHPEAMVAALEQLIEVHRRQADEIAREVAAARRLLSGRSAMRATSATGPGHARRRSEIPPRSLCRHCPGRRP